MHGVSGNMGNNLLVGFKGGSNSGLGGSDSSFVSCDRLHVGGFSNILSLFGSFLGNLGVGFGLLGYDMFYFSSFVLCMSGFLDCVSLCASLLHGVPVVKGLLFFLTSMSFYGLSFDGSFMSFLFFFLSSYKVFFLVVVVSISGLESFLGSGMGGFGSVVRCLSSNLSFVSFVMSILSSFVLIMGNMLGFLGNGRIHLGNKVVRFSFFVSIHLCFEVSSKFAHELFLLSLNHYCSEFFVSSCGSGFNELKVICDVGVTSRFGFLEGLHRVKE